MIEKEFSREKIEKTLQKALLEEFNEKEIQLILDYYLDNKFNEETIKLYKEVIRKKADNFFKQLKSFDRKEIKDRKITTLVSFLSSASFDFNDILLESSILRTIRAIPSINSIFIIYTKESEKNFIELREYMNSLGKEVTGKMIENNSIDESYKYLKTLAKAREIDRENTILDFTFGTKMLGVSFYKIAVERGITLITWEESHLPLYKKNDNSYQETKQNKRIPFLTKLIFIEEPIIENARIHRALISELKKLNFSGAMGYYEALGLDEMKKLCKDLDKIFNINNILDLDSITFYLNLKISLRNILKYDIEDEKARETIKKVLLRLLPIIDYKKTLLGINSFNIRAEEVDDYINELEKTDKDIKEKIYYSFAIKLLETKLKENCLEHPFVRAFIRDISRINNIKVKGESLKDVFDFIFIVSDAEQLEKLMLKEKEEKKKILKTKSKLENLFNIYDDLIIKEEKPIELNRNILKLLKYNIHIDLLEEYKKISSETKNREGIFTKESSIYGKIKYNRIAIPLIKLINEEIPEINEEVLEEIYNNKKVLSKGTISKNKSELKNIRDFINQVVQNELKKLGKEPQNLIIFSEDNPLKMHINEFFKNIR